jgi:hypothetical protein
MSETQDRPRTSRKHEDHAARSAPVFDKSNPFALGASSFELKQAGLTFDLPVRFVAGMVMDETIASIVQDAVEAQFRNNQNANVANRAKRFEAATTDAERDANKPLTADDFVALFVDYLPNARVSNGGETTKRMAAWNVINALIEEHNTLVKTGQPGILPSPAAPSTDLLGIPKGAKEQAIDNILSTTTHAERIQREIDRLLAERQNKPPKAAGQVKAVSFI